MFEGSKVLKFEGSKVLKFEVVDASIPLFLMRKSEGLLRRVR